jgi:hypothetical protein
VRTIEVWASLAAVTGAVLACGCSGGGGNREMCAAVEPCGGDVQGTWSTVASCSNPASAKAAVLSLFGLTCPAATDATLRSDTFARSIDTSFGADGTYSGTVVSTGTIRIDIPSACLPGASCSDLDAAVRAMIATPSAPAGPLIAGACTGDGDVCACYLTQQTTTSESGTYSVSGHVVETVKADGTKTDTDYCVADGRLHLVIVDTSSSTGPGGQATIAADVVLEKQ